MKANADETFLMTFVDKDNKLLNLTLPIVDFAIDRNQKEVNLIFQNDFNLIEEKRKELSDGLKLVVDYTDDPTPAYAGSVISLGYPLVRIQLAECKISSYNPLVISGPFKTLKINFNREQRDSLIQMPQVLKLNEKIDLTDKSDVLSYYRIPRGWETPLYIISCVNDDKQHKTVVEMMDMTSFHHKGDLIELKNHKTKKIAEKYYMKIVKERVENAN